MKIDFVITDMSSGGAERVVSLVANYFSEKHQVRLILVQDDRIDYKIHPEIEVVCLNRKYRKPFSIPERIFGIRRQTRDADIVISFLWHINIYTILATRFRHQKVIISDRSDPVNELKDVSAMHRKMRDICYAMADQIVFQTEEARNFYKKRVRKLGRIIPNPITPDLPKWIGPDRCDKRIITAGRLSEQKNLHMGIDAFFDFYQSHPEYSYVIYGEGSLRKDLEEHVAALGMSDVIRMPGFSSNIFEELSRSAIFILPSNYEGISNSMLEALAIGVPSVVTDCPAGGAKMFIKNGENGILIPVHDVKALTEGMVRLADDSEFAKKLSDNAQILRDALTSEKICGLWAEVVDELWYT